MEQNYTDQERYLRAEKRIKELKGFYGHLFWYLVVNLFLLIRIYMKLEDGETILHYKYFSTAFFWGIGIFFHFIGVFIKNNTFFKGWEDRKIKDFMEKDTFES